MKNIIIFASTNPAFISAGNVKRSNDGSVDERRALRSGRFREGDEAEFLLCGQDDVLAGTGEAAEQPLLYPFEVFQGAACGSAAPRHGTAQDNNAVPRLTARQDGGSLVFRLV